jgi:1,4-alpha-glucan branching enzyme
MAGQHAPARMRGVRVSAAEGDPTPLDLLRQENDLLRATLGGVALAEAPPGGPNPEDFWTPAITVPDDTAYVEQYGAISNIPDHDGTECFKVGAWRRGGE